MRHMTIVIDWFGPNDAFYKLVESVCGRRKWGMDDSSRFNTLTGCREDVLTLSVEPLSDDDVINIEAIREHKYCNAIYQDICDKAVKPPHSATIANGDIIIAGDALYAGVDLEDIAETGEIPCSMVIQFSTPRDYMKAMTYGNLSVAWKHDAKLLVKHVPIGETH